MKIENSVGRIVETEIAGETLKPFAGAKKYSYSSKVTDLKDALKKCGINDGDEISVDFTTGELIDKTQGETYKVKPFSKSQLEVYTRGGLL